MGLPKKEAHSGRYPLITRWTKEQYLEIERRAARRDMPMMQYIERKVFDMPTEIDKHPAPRERDIIGHAMENGTNKKRTKVKVG